MNTILNPILKDKILSLYADGSQDFKDYRSIQNELKRPSETVSTVTESRPQFPAELKLFNLIVPNVATFADMVAAEQKKTFVESRLLELYETAQDKAPILALTLRITNAFQEVSESGSAAFNDPLFLSPTVEKEVRSFGPSWLEANGFDSYPSKYEILSVLEGAQES